DYLERALKEVNGVADLDVASIFPLGIDNRFVTGFELAPLANRDVGEVCVLVVLNPVNQSLSETGIALVERLPDRSCRPDARYRFDFRGADCRHPEFRTTEADSARRSQHDLGADV